MMNSDEFLKQQIELLIDMFGRNAVLEGLNNQARVDTDNPDHSHRKVAKSTSRKRKVKSTDEQISDAIAKHPHRAEEIRRLGSLFQAGIFLTSVREINHFLARYGSSSSRIESRAKALPRVLATIAELNTDEVRKLSEAIESPSRSSLGLIADAVLSRD